MRKVLNTVGGSAIFTFQSDKAALFVILLGR
jgi:hypothetical protein